MKKKESERRKRRTTTGVISRKLVRQAVKSKLHNFQKRYNVLESAKKKLIGQGRMSRAERHDMNSYLSSIYGHMELTKLALKEENFSVGRVSKRLELVKRLSKLGVRLLMISKNRPAKRWTAEALGERVLEYPKIMRLTYQLDDPKVKIYVNNRAKEGSVKADDRWLSRLVLNLTANAIRAVEWLGGEGGKVYVTAGVKDGKFNIMVADNGKGMTAEQKEKFETGKRFTTKEKDQADHGLGFQVVKKALEMHQASVKIKDNKPKGTIFLVDIPLAK